ncbi:neuronal PAS domain-containing protein 4-like [Pristis pectinata]|uniref:neuronal PAS domain-containing protein 4-like n=1 Tax=Pristis pectinata TaxID=685728 RepID=UPI00223CF24B|nr:neuronal PAS domain-containing protein 4-like [Pristis pectinata]
MYRSTKGASKARRDQINAEIRSLKELLPISDADKSRLSYLHIMSLACIYTRKSVFFNSGADVQDCLPLISPQELRDFLHSLPGFLMALSSEGKLIYVSENVSDHLGHSLVDLVAQGDSIYDITDPLDHLVLSAHLMQTSSPETERLFRCRFNTSRSVRRQSAGNKMVLIRGRYHQPPAGTYWSSKPVFMAFCSPLDTRPRLFDNHLFLAFFQSRHAKDMMFVEVSDSVAYHLGYQDSELVGKSWYSLVHPQDLSHASTHHYRLVSGRSESRVEMAVRLQSKDGPWVWVYLVAQLECAEVPVLCHNYTISENEAWCLRQQLSEEELDSQMFPYALPALPSQHDALDSPPYLSSPDTVFTPMSGTPTSGVSGQSFDFSGICLEFAEGPAAPEEEDGARLLAQGVCPQQEDVERLSGPNTSSAKLPELAYSDCVFGPESPTPPCTPRLPGPMFAFGGRDTYGPTSSELFYCPETCAPLYEKMPPSPDSPGNGGGMCSVMGFPKVRAPLYIHVPSTPEGLLTPEASPIKMTVNNCFGYLEGNQRAETKSWPKSGDQGLAEPGEILAGGGSSTRASSLPTSAPFLDFQAPKHWRSVDFSLVTYTPQEEESEDVIRNLLKDLEVPALQSCSPAPGCLQKAGSPSRPAGLDSEVEQSPDSRPATDLSPEEQSFLEELASYETVFETYASRSPCDGFNDELYQLQSRSQEYFQQDGSRGDPSF